MEQAERRIYLIKALLAERPERCEGMTIPRESSRQRRLLRALLNVRPPEPASGAFLRMQDAYLREELARKGVTDAEALPDVREGLSCGAGTSLRCAATPSSTPPTARFSAVSARTTAVSTTPSTPSLACNCACIARRS